MNGITPVEHFPAGILKPHKINKAPFLIGIFCSVSMLPITSEQFKKFLTRGEKCDLLVSEGRNL